MSLSAMLSQVYQSITQNNCELDFTDTWGNWILTLTDNGNILSEDGSKIYYYIDLFILLFRFSYLFSIGKERIKEKENMLRAFLQGIAGTSN